MNSFTLRKTYSCDSWLLKASGYCRNSIEFSPSSYSNVSAKPQTQTKVSSFCICSIYRETLAFMLPIMIWPERNHRATQPNKRAETQSNSHNTQGLSLSHTPLAWACSVRGSLVTSMHAANLERDMWHWELWNLNFSRHVGMQSEGMETGLWTYGGLGVEFRL